MGFCAYYNDMYMSKLHGLLVERANALHLHFTLLVDKAASGGNISIHLNIERAEGEFTAALTTCYLLLAWLPCLSVHAHAVFPMLYVSWFLAVVFC